MREISKKKLLEKYHRKFANGEQYIELDLRTKTIIETGKEYYWQEKGVYNHILPIINTIARGMDEDLIYGENGLVALLIPYQRAYNAIKNRELEHINRQTMGVLVVEDGSVDIDGICEEGVQGGKVLVYRQGSQEPAFEMNGINTRPYIESSENILKEMYRLADAFCFGKIREEKNEVRW